MRSNIKTYAKRPENTLEEIKLQTKSSGWRNKPRNTEATQSRTTATDASRHQCVNIKDLEPTKGLTGDRFIWNEGNSRCRECEAAERKAQGLLRFKIEYRINGSGTTTESASPVRLINCPAQRIQVQLSARVWKFTVAPCMSSGDQEARSK